MKKNTTKTKTAFENLKNLNTILSGGELNTFVLSLNKTKASIDTFVKAIKQRETTLEKEQSIAKEVKQVKAIEGFSAESTATSLNELKDMSKDDNKIEDASTLQSKPQKFVKYTEEEKLQYNKNKEGATKTRSTNFDRQNKNNNYQNRNYQGKSDNFQNRGTFQTKNNYEKTNKPNLENTTSSQGSTRTYTGSRFQQNTATRPNSFDKNKTFDKSDKKLPLKPRLSGLLGGSSADNIIVAKPDRTFGNKNKSKQNDSEKKELNKKAKIRMGYIVLNEDFENEERMGRVRPRGKKSKQLSQPIEKINIEKATITTDNLTVKMLSEKIGKPAVDIIKKFFMLGMMPNINSVIDFPTAELVAQEFGVTLELKVDENFEQQLSNKFENQNLGSEKRPPIVTVMGHVDHGKTSLLDAIRKTNVISGEAGGITQHIGAYVTKINGNKITFIDTPGHEAFTSMRARGARVTDIAILVVAADDGIMPQTVEAINHIKAANVPMLVAINKIDKSDANVDKVKQQLTEYDVVCEEWGGDTICVPISAKSNIGIEKLLEMVILVGDMTDLTADKDVDASGYILESKVDKGRGIEATMIVKNGTLNVGDFVVCGVACGRIRAMVDFKGESVKIAEPSTPVSILGFNIVPEAGDMAYVVDEKMAKNIINERTSKLQLEKSKQGTNITLEDFLQKSADFEIKVLNIIIKADVKGSAEALKQTLEKIHNDEVKVACIHASAGGINESDVMLAIASKAIIIGFNVRPEIKAKTMADKNGVEIKTYKIIYDAVDEVTASINGMLTPKFKEEVTAHVEIRHIFKISSLGNIAGCYVLDGEIFKNNKVRLLRNSIIISETEIETLQQQKDEVKSVRTGFECGIKLKNFNDIKLGDIIESYEIKQI